MVAALLPPCRSLLETPPPAVAGNDPAVLVVAVRARLGDPIGSPFPARAPAGIHALTSVCSRGSKSQWLDSPCVLPLLPSPPPARENVRRWPGPADAEAAAEVDEGNGKTAGPRADVTRDTVVVQGRECFPPKSWDDAEDSSSRRPSGNSVDGLDGDGIIALGKQGIEEEWFALEGSSRLFPSGWSPLPQVLAKPGPVPSVSVSG